MKKILRVIFVIIFLFSFFETFTSKEVGPKFSVVSWNVMAHFGYEEEFKKVKEAAQKNDDYPFVPVKNIISVSKRLQEIKARFKDEELARADVICLQELDMSEGKEGKEICDYLTKTLGYKVGKYDKKNAIATSIFFNSNKFELKDSSFKKFSVGDWNFTQVTLGFKGKTNLPTLKLINCQIPPDEEAKQLENIDNLINEKNEKGFTIVCGDFNYDVLDKDQRKSHKKLVLKNRFDKNYWWELFEFLPEAYEVGEIKKLDYAFFNFQPIEIKGKYFILEYLSSGNWPQKEKLIRTFTQKEEKAWKPEGQHPHPSSHKILKMEFTVVDVSKEEKLFREIGSKLENLAGALRLLYKWD